MNERESLLILNGISGLGNIRIRKLLEFFGSAQKVLNATLYSLKNAGVIPQAVAENITRFKQDEYLKKELDLTEKHNVKITTFDDHDFPENLKHIPDAPVILYVKGTLKKEDHLAIAMVGSRRASFYGQSIAEKLSLNLAELGMTVVSGLARGIDASAHQGALKAKGRTIAVLGNGLAKVYPPENKKIFDAILDSGAVVSEFPMTTEPLAYNFPRRNRIISGLSLGVVVVEAADKSGALITARFALEQGREVFAVPGEIDSPNSRGVHRLIKQGAKLISGVEDILEELQPQLRGYLKNDSKEERMKEEPLSVKSLSAEEKNIYSHLSNHALHIDDIVHTCGFSAPQAMNALLKLELKHLIKQLPGKLFIKSTTNG